MKDVSDKLESKESIITQLQAKLAAMKEQVNHETQTLAGQQIVLQKPADEQKSTLGNSNLLIKATRQKNAVILTIPNAK